VAEIDERTALYRLYDARGVLLYVGISGDPEFRFTQHEKEKPWWRDVARRDIEWFEARPGAAAAEVAAIKIGRPRHNEARAGRAVIKVPASEEQVIGLDVLRRQLGRSREEVIVFLLDRELAARGLLGDVRCFHSTIGWPPGITISVDTPCECDHQPTHTRGQCVSCGTYVMPYVDYTVRSAS
jgi:hypothetical protein